MNQQAKATRRKKLLGRVIGRKMDKTVVVSVESRHRHPLYHRVLRHLRRFKAHDEQNACQLGDWVRIEESRPLSREKRWQVIEILARAEVPEVKPSEIA